MSVTVTAELTIERPRRPPKLYRVSALVSEATIKPDTEIIEAYRQGLYRAGFFGDRIGLAGGLE